MVRMTDPKIDLTKFPREARAELRRAVAEGGVISASDVFRAERSGPVAHGVTDLSRLAQQFRDARDQRERFFNRDLFAEPAWDILLTLFIAKCEGYRLGVTDVTYTIPVPATTGLRWIETLQRNELITRSPHPHDKRKTYIELTDAGYDQMTKLLNHLQNRFICGNAEASKPD